MKRTGHCPGFVQYKDIKERRASPLHWNIHSWRYRNQLYVQALGGINIQWHSNPHTQTLLQWSQRRDLPTCHCVTALVSPELSAAGNKTWFCLCHFFWCPLPGGLKASPLEWHGTHKQFYSLWFPKMFWKYPADYWRAKLWCCFSSSLCLCVTDTHCADRGRIAISFGFISQEFYVFHNCNQTC